MIQKIGSFYYVYNSKFTTINPDSPKHLLQLHGEIDKGQEKNKENTIEKGRETQPLEHT